MHLESTLSNNSPKLSHTMNPSSPEPVRSTFSDDPDFQGLLESYVGSVKEKIEACRSAKESGNYADLKVLTHQIKGSGTGYGFPEVSRLAGDAEADYIEGNHEEANNRLELLISYLSRIEL